MSYILEAIKKAESERGNKRLSQAVINEALDRTNAKSPIPWIAISIFVNAAILLSWIGYQVFYKQESGNENMYTPASSGNQKDEVHDDLTTPKGNEQDDIVATPDVDTLQTTNFVNQSSNSELEQDEVMTSLKKANDVDVLSDEVRSQKTDKNSPPISVDEMIDQEVPEFFAVKQPKQEVPKSNHADEEKINLHEPGEISAEKIIKAKVEPIPQHVEIVESLDLDATDKAVSKSLEDNLPALPTVQNNDVPSIEELPYSLQKQIPNLVISVHIYNVDKLARKVRVNGTVLYEGEQVDDVFVEEITPRGVVFDYEGTLFRKTLH